MPSTGRALVCAHRIDSVLSRYQAVKIVEIFQYGYEQILHASEDKNEMVFDSNTVNF